MVDEVEPAAPVPVVLRAPAEVLALPPVRLVAARIADDMDPPPERAELPPVAAPGDAEAPSDVLPPDLAATCWLPPPPKLALRALPPSRPKPDRLPRICGVVNETNFSAPVVPERRSLLSRRRCSTVAVRTPPAGPPPLVSCGVCWVCVQYQPPAPTIATSPRPHIQPVRRRGSSGGAAGGGTMAGRAGCCDGSGNGSGFGDALEADMSLQMLATTQPRK